MPRLPVLLALLTSAAAGAAIAACSATGDTVTSGQGGTSSSATGTGGSGGDEPLFDSGKPDGLDPDAACGLITEQAIATPLDLYIMFDKSSSMVGNKWDSAKAGLSAFVNDSSSAGVRVALNFFPLTNNSTCDQFAYKPPVVPFGELPQNAQAIIQALNAASPDGFSTPMYPALGGAILAGFEVAQNNPGHSAAVLLVTDGQPQGPAPLCGSVNPEDPQAIADLAAKGFMLNPSVSTFVIGLPGVNQSIANQIAAAGGTDAAILVSNANVEAEFQSALAKVRGKALPCEFEIPEKVAGGEVDKDHVNVLVTPGGGQVSTLPQDPSCVGEGWHYDNPATPKKIVLCPASCTSIKKDLGVKVQILLGCKTEILK